ncbi:MAG: aminofutalosine synthase MqnE [Candidatus Eisenbacteria bacterium]|nr:aminofutalosine synthase MqnE [Candidatus Eisenbacteria bacterium]
MTEPTQDSLWQSTKELAEADLTAAAARAPERNRARSHLPDGQPESAAFLNGQPRPEPDLRFRDPALEPIWRKVQTGERLTRSDGLTLFASPDLNGLGAMADWRKTQLHGDQAYFVFNRQVNPTNLCVLDCKFCDYAHHPLDPKGYAMSIDQVLAKLSPELREVHIVGGLHHQWRFDYYVDVVRQIRRAFPTIQIKAYTAVEIDFFAKIAKLSIERVLETLVEAGLDSMPGGGAEVFSERVRAELFPKKIGAEAWLNVHRIAHRMGIPTNSTLLYGHIETHEERVDHMLLLRELEDEAPGFLAFIPLAFQTGYSDIVKRGPSAVEDLKTIAAARLLMDNMPHIKSYWVMLGEDTASVGLNFGASDIDGTIFEEKIAHAALAESPVGLARERILQMIREAGKIPVERDALYNIVDRYPIRASEPGTATGDIASTGQVTAPGQVVAGA